MAFWLNNRTAGYQAQGDADTCRPCESQSTTVYLTGRGVGMVVGPTEDGVPVSLPDDLTGGTTFPINGLQLWGPANGVVNVYRDLSWEVSGIKRCSPFEFVLRASTAIITGFVITPFAGESGSASDQFQTRNQFYGATVGGRGDAIDLVRSAEVTGSRQFTNESLDIFALNNNRIEHTGAPRVRQVFGSVDWAKPASSRPAVE